MPTTRGVESDRLDEAVLRKIRIGGWLRSMKGAALSRNTSLDLPATICGIQTGHTDAGAKTVLPSTAMARLDFRLVPDLTPSLVLELLRAHLDVRGFSDIEIIELGSAPWPRLRDVTRGPFSDRARSRGLRDRAAYLSNGSFEWTVGAVCGVSSPATPVASFGVSYAGSNPHGLMKISLDDFLLSVKFLGRVISRLGESKAEIKSEKLRTSGSKNLISSEEKVAH